MSKKIMLSVEKEGDALMRVGDAGTIEVGDEVEWVSGDLDVTLEFPRKEIFGKKTFPMPPEVTALTLTVKEVPDPPSQQPEDYRIIDDPGGDFPGGTAQNPRNQPVMIFGP